MSAEKAVIHATPKLLKAAAYAAAKSDIRWYLQGVYIEATADQTIAVATNGHFMVAVRDQAKNEVSEPTSLILPAKIVAALSKPVVAGRWDHAHRLQRVGGNKWSCELPGWGCGLSATFSQVDGKYPDWRRVIPSSMSGEPGVFNQQYVHLIHEAAKAFTNSKQTNVIVMADGPVKGAVVRADTARIGDFIGIVMPIRSEIDQARFLEIPKWATA
ncbi:hypothetical protein [Pigmentiphaga kullae]|uniref:Beta sliding clamp n=1 Tax=Pigmentiphaga kullae TaxID=151784 RepID=A0A4Q7NCJ2_9BURK|nr:hypothetical protein [Pigmentiphaga kullae]RZS80633.1 DNA polymerase-3 subunit beta [Pigmentiphaga kullae]